MIAEIWLASRLKDLNELKTVMQQSVKIGKSI